MDQQIASDRRHALRQHVNTPAFASFDGVTGGVILDLSEEGLAMQTIAPLEAHKVLPVHVSLGEPAAYLETTGYVAWADALGRAGVRFSELPDKARERLRDWLTDNASAPSWKAPRWIVSNSVMATPTHVHASFTLNLESQGEINAEAPVGLSTTAQYEFKSLGSDTDAALTVIASRACAITRGTGAAVALLSELGMTCRAVAGNTAPQLGSPVDSSHGFTGACIREARALRCDNTGLDSRADAEACKGLGVRSILAAPILYERDLVGLLEVFSSFPYAFDDGDLAVVERLAQTVVLTLSRADMFREEKLAK